MYHRVVLSDGRRTDVVGSIYSPQNQGLGEGRLLNLLLIEWLFISISFVGFVNTHLSESISPQKSKHLTKQKLTEQSDRSSMFLEK